MSRLSIALKVLVPVVVVGFLAWRLSQISDEDWGKLQACEKNWGLLGVAFALALAAVSVSFARWYLLVRALDIPFRLMDAFRLGFLGFMLAIVSVGVVGGDFFKAVFISREQAARRAEAVATVIVDRMIGLYALLVVTSIAIFCGGVDTSNAKVEIVCQVTVVATILGGVGILMMLLPGVTNGRLSTSLANLPKAGPLIERVIIAMRMYRSRPLTLLTIALMSLMVHGLIVLSVHSIAYAIVPTPATMAEHFVIVPLSMVAGAIPIPGGIGTMEAAMDQLYIGLSSGEGSETWGLLIALVYRLINFAMVGVGAVVYWTSRSEVQAVMAEAEGQAIVDEPPSTPDGPQISEVPSNKSAPESGTS